MLARHGYRVLAVDLLGHGRSEPDPDATSESFVEAVVRSVPTTPSLVVGHSMGGSILARAVAATRLAPAAAVYVETPFSTPPMALRRNELRTRYAQHKASRTQTWYRQNRPSMADVDIDVEAEASRLWDVDTATSLSWHAAGSSSDPGTHVPSLIIRADPSDVLDVHEAAALQRRGFTVRSMPGAGHDVWPGRAREFVELIVDWRLALGS